MQMKLNPYRLKLIWLGVWVGVVWTYQVLGLPLNAWGQQILTDLAESTVEQLGGLPTSGSLAAQMPSEMRMPAEVPQPTGSKFGFSYPPPPVGEPGVTPFRRWMLEGAQDLPVCKRPDDEVWLVSSRAIKAQQPCSQQPLSSGLRCDQFCGDRWTGSGVQQLIDQHRTDPSRPTFIFVHGNRTDSFWAQRRGLQVYQSLFGSAKQLPPVRFVIWSWPTDVMRGPLIDFQTKSERALFEGQVFGEFLVALGKENRVSLMGYSLGTQVVLGGLEVAAQTSVQESSTAESQDFRYPMMVIAPVTHCHWPQCEQQVDMVLSQCGEMTAFRNPQDKAIRAFHLFCQQANGLCYDAQQMGIDALIMRAGNVHQYDLSQVAGREHNIVRYSRVEAVRKTGQVLAFSDGNLGTSSE